MVGAHALSLEVFGDGLPKGMWALHHCDRPDCIEPKHLYAGTQLDNAADMMRRGRHRAMRGETHKLAKLTEIEARAIKLRLAVKCKVNMSAVAREFGVSESLVRSIRDGRGWAWL